jgi:hypothetical protein
MNRKTSVSEKTAYMTRQGDARGADRNAPLKCGLPSKFTRWFRVSRDRFLESGDSACRAWLREKVTRTSLLESASKTASVYRNHRN